MKNWKALALILGGVLVGVLLGPPESSTSAATPPYRECVWYCGFNFAETARSIEENVTAVPAGWTPIGGSGKRCVLICR